LDNEVTGRQNCHNRGGRARELEEIVSRLAGCIAVHSELYAGQNLLEISGDHLSSALACQDIAIADIIFSGICLLSAANLSNMPASSKASSSWLSGLDIGLSGISVLNHDLTFTPRLEMIAKSAQCRGELCRH